MCFSASASFGAGAVLSVIGAASLVKVESKSQIVFAFIPFVFSIQQTAEGLLWLTIPDPYNVSVARFVTYIYVFIAQVVWPLLIPASILLLEKDVKRQKILTLLAGIGIIEAAYQVCCLYSFPVQSEITGMHISYTLNHPPVYAICSGIFYILATIVPPFISSIKRMWAVALIVLISALFTLLFFDKYVISIWCFFASVISLSVYAIINQMSYRAAKAESL